MRRILGVVYSQTGQTARAMERYLEGAAPAAEYTVSRVNLAEDPGVRGMYHHPWSFFDFLRALPGSHRPELATGSVPLDGVDILVIAYPVWFLSPAAPVGSFLRGLPAGALDGKAVITISTSRNMWFEAQRLVRRLVEAKGGRVHAHVALEDRGPTYATLITTPRFFLTGKDRFQSPLASRLFPPFGVAEGEYAALREWAGAHPAGAPPADGGFFKLKTPLALAEVVGRRIFSALLTPWAFFRHRGKVAQNAYLLVVAACTMLGILLLLPPLAILGSLPPLRQILARRWRSSLISKPPAAEAGTGERMARSAAG